MISRFSSTLLGMLLIACAPAAALSQEGFALKFGAAFNSTDVQERESGLRLSDAAGWNVGAEYLLPAGISVGLSGYSSGSPRAFDLSEGSLVFLGDVNYFLRLPGLPIAPYAGLHVGLGSYRLRELSDAYPVVDFGDRGHQFGVRFQPTSLIGIDAQYRQVSGSMDGLQGSEFERKQVLLSVTLF